MFIYIALLGRDTWACLSIGGDFLFKILNVNAPYHKLVWKSSFVCTKQKKFPKLSIIILYICKIEGIIVLSYNIEEAYGVI